MVNLPSFLACIIAIIGAFLITVLSIPRIIFIARRKGLVDVPDNNRKVHSRNIPNLGGIAIFSGFIIMSSLMVDPAKFTGWNYITASVLLLFFTGIKDDLISLPPYKKFISQFCAALLTVWLADIRIHSLYGFLGIQELPYVLSILFTTVGCMFVTNAFNLIDGIDGLAGSIGALASGILGICLAIEGNTSAAAIAFSLTGALIGFLRYNISPAQIFMGDTGSLIIGFMISILCILFSNSFHPNSTIGLYLHNPKSVLIFSLGVLFIPIFDTFRVFITRSIKGRSPFRADRTHFHHYLLDLGFSHNNAVSTILFGNVFIIFIALWIQDLKMTYAVTVLLAVAMALFAVVFFMRRRLIDREKQIEDTSGFRKGKNDTPSSVLNGFSRNNIVATHYTLNGKKVSLGKTETIEGNTNI